MQYKLTSTIKSHQRWSKTNAKNQQTRAKDELKKHQEQASMMLSHAHQNGAKILEKISF